MRTDSTARPVYAIRWDSKTDRTMDLWIKCDRMARNAWEAETATHREGFKAVLTSGDDFVVELAPGDDVGEPGYVWTVLVHK